MDQAAYVAVGAVAGALLRWKTANTAVKYGVSVPHTTAAINVVGSFVLGAIAARAHSPHTKLLVGTGFCGSFTTFSTFSVDVVNYLDAGKYGRALFHIGATNMGAVGAAAVAYKLFKKAK